MFKNVKPTGKTVSRFRWHGTTPTGETATNRARRHLKASILITALVLIGVGLWTYDAVRESLDDVFSEGLMAILDANAEAHILWSENEKTVAKSWAVEPDVKRLIEAITVMATRPNVSAQKLLESTHLRQLRETLDGLSSSQDYIGFAVVDSTGRLLASNDDRLIGVHLSPLGTALFGRAFHGETLVSKPYAAGQLLREGVNHPQRPVILVITPVLNNNGEAIAALGLRLRPDGDYSRILSITHLGDSGDTYVFDENGIMISESRHLEELKSLELLPDTPDASAIFNVQLRDPGGNLTKGYRSASPVEAHPSTQLIAAALANKDETQIVLEPYRDYRGVPVVGAALWMSQKNFGIATEVNAKDAWAALRPLSLAFSGLLLLLVVAVIAVIVSSQVIGRLKRHIGEVKRLGQYTLETKIGEGGMGTVYLGRHAMLRRPTAIKLIRADQASEDAIERFEQEVQLTSRLTHSNTIEIYDFGRTSEGVFYYVMEYLPGMSLAEVLDVAGALPPARVIHVLRQLCASLREAHGIGLIHRDIKPLNIILTERGGELDFVKVLDFGLVKSVDKVERLDLTGIHAVPGTPPYIAPERLQDTAEVDARSDLFCLGVVAFNMLTGKPAFEASSAVEIAYHVMHTDLGRPSVHTDQPIPEKLDQLVLNCMAKKPEERPESAAAIIEVLDSITGAGVWTQSDAQQWWQPHKQRLTLPEPSENTTTHAQAITVNK